MPHLTADAIAALRGKGPDEAQREAARILANARRAERRQTIQAMKDGLLTFDQVMADPPVCLHTLLTISIVMLVPGVGKARRNRIAIQAFNRGVLITKDLGDLTDRQRTILAAIVHSA